MSDHNNPFTPNDGVPGMDGPATDDLEGSDRDVADEAAAQGDDDTDADDDKDADLNV
jgi:hypothetical protein